MLITPLVEPVNVCDAEFIFPLTDNDVPVAAPIFGVVKLGDVCKTTLPEPVAVVLPVPPFKIGKAVPDNEIANVPDVVNSLNNFQFLQKFNIKKIEKNNCNVSLTKPNATKQQQSRDLCHGNRKLRR